MELELGLKITRTSGDVSSSVDFRFSKDPFGPLVLSRETDSRFIIIIHLKGFRKEGIEIEINEEGNRITIKGRKPVEEMVMIKWMAWRKQVEFRVFKKVFRISDTVDLDEIKARFDDDDATLTITMPKRVKGISGFNIEEEEEDQEERVDKGQVVEEESIEREEEFGEIMENKERENQVLEGEEKGFSGGLEEEEFGEKESQFLGEEQKDEEETEDDYLDKSHQIDEQDKILERIQEENELADINKESEDSSLRKLPDIQGRDSHEQTRHDEQDQKQQLVEAESKSDDFGSRGFEEIEEQEPDEQLDRTSESVAKEKNTTDDDGDGLSKFQGIEEHDERKIQDMVQGKGGYDKKKIVKTEIKIGDPKEDVEASMGEGFTPNIDTTKVNGEDDITETEKKPDGFESDEVDKIHELAEKNEEKGEKARVIRQSEDRSLIKLQENKEQHSNGEKPHREHEKIKELVTDKTPKAETDIRTNIPKPAKEIEVPEVDTLGKTGDEGKEGKEKQNIVKKEIKNGDAKEKTDAKMGKVFASNIADTAMKSEDFESDKLESDEEVDKIKKLVEKKDKQEENAKVGAQSEDISLTKLQEIGEQQFQGQKRDDKQEEIKKLVEEQTPEAETNIGNDMPKPVQGRCEGKHKIHKLFQEETKNQQEEYKEKIKETGEMTNDAGARKIQEIIRQQELEELARSGKESKTRELVKNIRNDEEKEEKEIAETETKVQESNRPKILREEEKIQEVAEEKTNFSKNGKVNEEEEIAEKKTEFGGDDDDDISRKVRDSDAMKGQEEKDMIQELVLEEKVSDGGIGTIAVSEKKAEKDMSKKVQEIDEQQSNEEDICGKQFQKLIVGEVSGLGEVEDVKKTEEEKGIRDSTKKGQETEKTDSDVSGKYIKGTTIQELDDNREIYRNEHEEEKKYDRPEKITGTMEQELVNLNSQLEQDKVEDGEKTQEPVEEETKDCKEEEGSEESKIKTDDDVVRKVQGIKEEEFYEPKRDHVSKIKELLEEKTGDHEKEEEKELAESEIKAECSSLRKIDGSEEQNLNEPKIHKERDQTRITGAEKQSGQEKEKEKTVESMSITENENSTNVQEIMEERHEKPERHEKRFKIQEVVEAGHDDHKEEEREEKVMAKTELETEEESSKKVQKIEQQEYDGLKRSMVQDKMQETGEKEKTKAIEEKEILEKRTKTKDCSLRKVQDDEDLELSKPYKRQKEGKIHELVEMGTSDYREKVKKQDEDGEQSNFPQLEEGEKVENMAELREKMEDDSSCKFFESEEGKSYEDWTHKEREKRKDLVKEEATDPKDKHTGGDGHIDHKEEEQDEKVTAKAELKIEEDSSKKVQEIEKQEYDKLKRSMIQEKMRETEERDKTRAMEENEIVERRKKTRDGNLRKVQEGEDPELGRHKRHGEDDRIQELVETEISDHREKVKKKDILRSQETGKLDLSELERHWEERKNHQSVEDEEEEHKEQNKIAETKEEVPNTRSVREKKELEAHVQELEGKTENCRDHDGEGRRREKGKQGKTVETMSRKRFKTKSEDGIVGKIQETKVQESNEKKNKEGKGKIEEPDRKESSSHEVKLVTENDNLRKGQEFLEKESNVSKRGPVKEEKIQQLKKVETQDRVNEGEEQAEAEKKITDGKSSMNEEQKKIRKPMEEKSKAPEKEKEVNEKIAEERMQDKIDSRVKDKEIKGQEPYELLKHGEVDMIPKYHREEEKGIKQRETEEMKRTAEDVNLRKVQQTNDELEKHRKPSEIPEKHNIQVSVEEEPQKHREEEMNERGGYKALLQTESMGSRESQDVEEKGSDQPKRYAEQELMTEEDGKEEYHIREGEQKEMAKRLSQVESKANDDCSEKNETEGHESTELRGQKKNEIHQELVDIETSDQRKEEIEKEMVVGKAETIDEYDSSWKKIHGHEEERKSDKMSEILAEEETSDDDKEGNRAKAVLGEVETKIGKVREIEKQEQDKKQSFVEKDTSGKAKENKNQETKSRDESSGKTQENEKPESHEQKKSEEQDKKNHGNEHKEIAEAEVPRKLKGVEKQESTKMEERHENRDSIKELVEEKNQEGEDKKSMISEVLTKAEDDESKGPEGLRKEDKSSEQRLRDNLKDEKTAKTETKSKDNEARKIHEIKEEVSNEQERLKEQGMIKELVEDRTHYRREEENRETECEDGSSKKIQERDRKESIEPGRDKKRDKIQEPVDRETSEDNEEELEIEFEDEEEDWEAEVIQETDSDEDADNIRQIKRIRLGFRLVGGSTLFMSLIVIVISFIRSKRKIRCYKF